MVRRSKRRLNKNINVHCLSFLKTYKRFLTQGQFRNVMFETVFLNKSCWGGREVRTIKFVVRHNYWILIYERIISAYRELGKRSFPP